MKSSQQFVRWAMRREVIVPVFAFVLLYMIHFWRTLVAGDTLYGGPGDHTAGIIWLYDQDPSTPWWSATNKTSYPWGDMLWSPLFILGQIGYVLFWLCSRLTGGSVAGYNLFTTIAFVVSFAVAYAFIYKRFIKKPVVASLMALAMTFTPMALFLDGVGHTSYLFMPAYFIGVIWLILNLFEKRHAPFSAIGLGVLGGATFLFDPYFVLFIPLAAGLFFVSLLATRYGDAFAVDFRRIARGAGTAVATAMVIIAPVLIYLKRHAQEVGAVTGNTRGDILHDAQIYSARLGDFFLPSATNPFVHPGIAQLKTASFHGNDPTFTAFLGWTLLAAVVVTIYWWLAHKPVTEPSRLLRKVGLSLLVVAIGAFVFSLPPTIQVFSITLHTPTYLLAVLTPTWRVFARLYFIVQPALLLMVAAAIAEYYRSTAKHSRFKKRYFWPLLVVALCLLLVEYLPRNPFDAAKFWSYTTSLPRVYQTIKAAPIKVLAEYPMREQPHYRGSMYLSGQHVHNKALVNTYSPTSPTAYARMALMDINNPQTIPALRYLGVNALVVWSTKSQQWTPAEGDALSLVSSEQYSSRFGKNETVRLYTINPEGDKRRFVATIQSAYRPIDDDRLYDIGVPLQAGISLARVDLCNATSGGGCVRDAGAPNYYAAQIDNIDNVPVDVTLRAAKGGDTQVVRLQPGTNRVRIAMNDERYIAEFDQRLNGKIMIKNQEITQE